jgi:hypothetical protein
MMFNCPVCAISFEKRKNVDKHLVSEHPDHKTPYGCIHCTSSFASEKAAKQHLKRHIIEEVDPPNRKRQCLPFIGTVSEWVHTRYNPSRETVAEQLATSTVSRIQSFHGTLRFEDSQTLEQVLSFEDDGIIIELIDNWVDFELQSHSMQTVNNHVRYLKILLLFLQERIDSPDVEDSIIEYITDLVADTQTTTTRSTTTLNMLKLEDPFALAAIRDMVVNALLKEQVEYIHPYMISVVGGTHVDFGIRLRNWLELAIRFTNIPCRIQCTRELQMADITTSTYVAKLIARDGQLCRMINNDKTSSSHQPLLIPLGRSLSVYLYFYTTHCRPETDHSFVFCTRRGAKWTRPSRDLKQYMENILGIQVYEVDPTGRFIHGSRAIMMAVFALGVHFDQQKMHGFARLMRHSSTTNERFYSMWQNRALSNQAIDVFSDVMGLDFTSTTQSPAMYQPIRLRDVPPRILSAFLQGFVPISNIVPCYGTCSVGTQTGDEAPTLPESALQEIDVSDTQPRCTSCGLFALELYGPFGSMRRKRYVGRYYLACPTCHRNEDGRFVLQQCLWYPIGYIPIQKSNSSRPRNMLEIQSFIASCQL